MNKDTTLRILSDHATEGDGLTFLVDGDGLPVPFAYKSLTKGRLVFLDIPATTKIFVKEKSGLVEWTGSPDSDSVLGQLAPAFAEKTGSLLDALKNLPGEIVDSFLAGHGYYKGGKKAATTSTRASKGSRAPSKPNPEKYPVGTVIHERSNNRDWKIVGYSATGYKLESGKDKHEVSRFNRFWAVKS